MHWMFTKREKERPEAAARSRGDLDQAYVTEAPDAFRHQLMFAIADLAPSDAGYLGQQSRAQFFRILHRMLLEEYGVSNLGGDRRVAGPDQDFAAFVLSSASTPQLMDVVDTAPLALYRTLGLAAYHDLTQIREFTERVVTRMNEHRLPYDIVAGKVVSKENDVLHAEVVAPTLTLLHGRQEFRRVEEQYQDALRELGEARWADAITDANAAVEVALRKILAFEQGQLPDLLAEARKRGFFGDPQTARLRKLTDGLSILADIRNAEGDAHGGESDRGTAWLAVHIAGALIVYLVSRWEQTRK